MTKTVEYKPDWKKFEELVAGIQQQLASEAQVLLNQKILGVLSGTQRQIDVLLIAMAGQLEIRIIIECKDYKRVVGIDKIDAFITKLRDVRANKGILVSANGFSKDAKAHAYTHGISLYDLVDTRDHKWKKDVSLPTYVCITKLSGLQLRVKSHSEKWINPAVLSQMPVFNETFNELGTIEDIVKAQYNNPEWPSANELEDFMECSYYCFYKNEDQLIPITLVMNVENKVFTGSTPITNVSGFRDCHSEMTHMKKMQFTIPAAEEIQKHWMPVSCQEIRKPTFHTLIFYKESI